MNWQDTRVQWATRNWGKSWACTDSVNTVWASRQADTGRPGCRRKSDRQTWLPKEERLSPHCTENQVETEVHFLTSCPKYVNNRDTFYPLFTTYHKDFHQKCNIDKLPLLLGESPASWNLATRYVRSCHEERASSRTETANYTPRDTV